MKVTVKTVTQKIYEVDVKDDTISGFEMKKEIESKHGIDKNSIKLVFNGKIITDDKPIKEFGIKDGSVMIMATVKVNTDSKKEESKKEEEPPKNNNVRINNPQQNSGYINELKELADMGFSGLAAREAITAARGNVSLAVDVLTGGIDIATLTNINNNANLNMDLDAGEDWEGEEGEEAEEGEGADQQQIEDSEENLQKLASIAKVLCKGDAGKLNEVLESLVSRFPSILQIIENNYDEFMELFSQPISNEDQAIYNEFEKQIDIPEDSNLVTNVNLQPLESMTFTDKEKQDILNLVQLGFSEQDSIEAYLSCDKNEELAANYLFENKQPGGGDLFIDCKY